MNIDGKKIAHEILERLPKNSGKKVAFVSFQDDPRSQVFMRVKTTVGESIDVVAEIIKHDVTTTDEAITRIQEVGDRVDGIIIQLPLPENFDSEKILNAIPFKQDIDMLGEHAIKAFRNGTTKRTPPVAAAVWEVLQRNDGGFKEKQIVILGKGKLVGEPISQLFAREHIPFQAFDKNSDPGEIKIAIANADILITGLGQPHFVAPEMVQEGVVLIDCGTSESAGKLAGDIDPLCALKAALFTPVPGGIGPITVACLYQNLFLD